MSQKRVEHIGTIVTLLNILYYLHQNALSLLGLTADQSIAGVDLIENSHSLVSVTKTASSLQDPGGKDS